MDDDEFNTRYLEVAKIIKEKAKENKDEKTIYKFAILKDEHSCFGYFTEFDPDCEMCEASLCCEENTNDDVS